MDKETHETPYLPYMQAVDVFTISLGTAPALTNNFWQVTEI
jgi:hypothetical protein